MFGSIRNRLILIGAVVVLSIFYLYPRNVTQRERDPVTGVMRDTVITRVPIKLGLILGRHAPALELDQSARYRPTPATSSARSSAPQADRRVRRSRAGGAEAGDHRIVVQLAGIRIRPRKGRGAEESLPNRNTDETAPRRAIPSMAGSVRSSA